jgi:hypothetical protein
MNWKADISYIPHVRADGVTGISTKVKAPLQCTSASALDLSISLIAKV